MSGVSELRCPEECGGCPKCMGPAIELVEATERDQWKARAEKAEATLVEVRSYARTAAIRARGIGLFDEESDWRDLISLTERP